MAEPITKEYLEEILDKKFAEYNAAVVEAVDMKFLSIDKSIESFERKLDRLMNTLDAFLKRLTDNEDEFKLLKAEMDQVKSVLRERFGIEIAIQR